MKTIVVGAGTVGTNMARILMREGHEVTVMDAVAERLLMAEEQLDIRVTVGNACDPGILHEGQVEDADLLLAVTDRDETNLVCAYTAKRLGCKRVIARVRQRFFYDVSEVNVRDPLGIDLLISPEILAAYELANFVDVPSALALVSMARGRVQLRTLRLSEGSPFAGHALKGLYLPDGMLIAGLRRGEDVMIARGKTILEPGDRVTLVGLPEVLEKVSEHFDPAAKEKKLASVAIAGAGETGLFLGELLEKRGHDVTVIERDASRAHLAGERLDHAKVLLGDASDVDFLKEERIDKVRYYIAATGDDENNIMSSLLAKELGVEKVACLVDRPDYTRIVEKIGIDVALSPRIVVANRVLAMVKRGRIRSVTLLENGEMEINEFEAVSRSPIVGQPLRDVELPEEALIGAVVRGNQVRIPRGDDIIRPGSIVIALARSGSADQLDNLFADPGRAR